MENNLIYSDKLTDVCGSGLRMKKDYFPSAQAKFANYSEILGMERKPTALKHRKWRYWGTGDFKNWFSSDGDQSQRECLFFYPGGYPDNENRL